MFATKTISFKSTPENWRKEYLGIKRNTVREGKVDEDSRFMILTNYMAGRLNLLDITIENTKTYETFTRHVTDVTWFNGGYIISW